MTVAVGECDLLQVAEYTVAVDGRLGALGLGSEFSIGGIGETRPLLCH